MDFGQQSNFQKKRKRPKANDKQKKKVNYNRLTHFFKENKWKYVTGIFFLLLVNVSQLMIPRLIGELIDHINEKTIDSSRLLSFLGLILLANIMIYAMHFLSRYQIIGAGNLFDYKIRESLYIHLQKMSKKFYDKKPIGELMALSTNDISAIRMAMGRGITIIANTLFLLTISIIILIKETNIFLTVMVFAPFPLLILIMLKFGVVINKRFTKVQESFAKLTAKVQENISGIRVIKAFALESSAIEEFNKTNKENYNENINLAKVSNLFFPIIAFVSSVSFLLLFIFGGQMVIQKQITVGMFIALNGYVGMLIRPISFIGMIINFIQRGKASLSRLETVFQEKPEVKDHKKYIIKEEKLKGKIEIKNLTFSYKKDSTPVLKNINISLNEGTTLGVVGRVGSGKSTLAKILLRMYNPMEQGQYSIDDIDIEDIPLEKLHNSIGYVPQEHFLFSDTIKSNIAFTPKEVTQQEIEYTAKLSHIYDGIISFPNRFETLLGERGVNLSGGQKQRISIARALIKKPSILILDDCLSAVDTKTEEKILKSLKDQDEKCTTIMIAHRISTVKHADEIIVLDKGEIVERGTHQGLLEQKGIYYKMYQHQLLEEKVKISIGERKVYE